MSPTQLLDLPAELLHHVLTYLNPKELSIASRTCRAFGILGEDDRLWHNFMRDELPRPPASPKPCASWRELYATHHPYWFLPRSKIWFSDGEPIGKLLISRYDSETGSIVAHTITAVRGRHTLQAWNAIPGVIIHNFDPKVSLDLSRPVLQLDLDCATNGHYDDSPSGRSQTQPNRYTQEVIMPIATDPGLFESFMLCRALPESAITEQTQVWPPLRFPASSRTRNDSPGNFQSLGHRPSRASEVSQQSFRLHKWVEYNGRRTSANTIPRLEGLNADLGFNGPFYGGGGMNHRFPESISTFATLPEWCYTPTPQKPWQGVWCGDYSGHGCEFLLITQPDKDKTKPLPESMDWLRAWLEGHRRGSADSSGSFASAPEDMPVADVATESPPQGPADNDDPSGRLEAIKLTGDPNVPRGEYTFIAPDIGANGFVRVADEDPFRGARIVRSAGQIAGRGFREAQWTPSQLIMVSHDCLGQFWEGFGHISFYHRVDIEALMSL